MSDTLLVSTRKGLFWVRRQNGNWGIDRVDFPGDNVTLYPDRSSEWLSLRGARSWPFWRQTSSIRRSELAGNRDANLPA